MNLSQNLNEFPAKETLFLIDGPAGRLELLASPAKHAAIGVGVVCHPHPLHEGTMHNKVVSTVARAFHQKHLHTVRFNYRGVGQSQGVFGDSVGEIADLMAVLAWVDSVLPQQKLWLAGFSFGSYIAAMGATLRACQQLYTIAPAVHHQNYAQLPAIACPWIVIQGEQDEVVAPQTVYAWCEAQRGRQNIRLIKLPNVTHFFHGNLIQLRTLVEDTFIDIP